MPFYVLGLLLSICMLYVLRWLPSTHGKGTVSRPARDPNSKGAGVKCAPAHRKGRKCTCSAATAVAVASTYHFMVKSTTRDADPSTAPHDLISTYWPNTVSTSAVATSPAGCESYKAQQNIKWSSGCRTMQQSRMSSDEPSCKLTHGLQLLSSSHNGLPSATTVRSTGRLSTVLSQLCASFGATPLGGSLCPTILREGSPGRNSFPYDATAI